MGAFEGVFEALAIFNGNTTYKYILRVLILDGGNDSGGNHSLFPGLGQIEVVDTLLGTLINVRFHLLGHVLGSDVHLVKYTIIIQTEFGY